MNVVDLVRFSRTRTDLERFVVKNPGIDLDKLLDKLESGELMKQAKKCAYVLCNEPFIAERKDQIYCGKGTCKMAAYRLKKGQESTELSEVLSRARDAELQWHGVAGQDATAKQRRDDTLRAAYDALAAALGIVHETPVVASVEAPVEAAPVVASVEAPVEAAPVVASVEAPVEVPVPVEVREKLRAFIAETSFSQKKVARLTGTSQPSISQFLSGKTDGSEDFRRAILDLVTQDHGLDRR